MWGISYVEPHREAGWRNQCSTAEQNLHSYWSLYVALQWCRCALNCAVKMILALHRCGLRRSSTVVDWLINSSVLHGLWWQDEIQKPRGNQSSVLTVGFYTVCPKSQSVYTVYIQWLMRFSRALLIFPNPILTFPGRVQLNRIKH